MKHFKIREQRNQIQRIYSRRRSPSPNINFGATDFIVKNYHLINQKDSTVNNSPTEKYGDYIKYVRDQNIQWKNMYVGRKVKTPIPSCSDKSRTLKRRSLIKQTQKQLYSFNSNAQHSRIHNMTVNKTRKDSNLMHPSSLNKIRKCNQTGQEELEEDLIRQKYQGIEFMRDLGKGAHALVRSAVDWKNNRKIAIKIYRKKQLQLQQLTSINTEILILKKIDHPSIAKLYDVFETPNTINLIMQYGGGNSLTQYLNNKPQRRFGEQQTRHIFQQVLRAMAYLHNQNIVHRDIKPDNILVNKHLQIKIIDFGFSLISPLAFKIKSFCGTPTYMAPQVVNKREYVGIYSDRWSLGILLYHLLQGVYPFRANNETQLFGKISIGKFEYVDNNISLLGKNLIEGLIKINPLERLSPEQCLKHAWFAQQFVI